MLGVKFLLFPLEKAKKLDRKFRWIGNKLSALFYGTRYDLVDAGIDADAEEYLTAAFFSAAIYFAIGVLFASALLLAKKEGIEIAALLFSGMLFFMLFLALHIIYPKIIAKRRISEVNACLASALNNLLIQLSAGIGIYEAMNNLSKAGYGEVGKEFGRIVEDINSGTSEMKALEKSALKSKSEYFKKALWQIITGMGSGASMHGSISAVLDSINRKQSRAVKDYGSELNMWILFYLLGAAAIPSLGITFLVMLSSFSGASVNETTLLLVAAAGISFQILMIGFVKTRVPKVFSE